MTRVILSVVLLAGCGGPPEAVRTTLSITAAGVVEADAIVAGRYSDQAALCYDSSMTRAEYDLCIAPWDRVADALEAARSALLALESATDAWGAGSEAQWGDLAACALGALQELVGALTAAGVAVPEEIASAVRTLGALGGSCHE